MRCMSGAVKRILFVDDDPHLLAALRAVFRKECGRWEMVFVKCGADAVCELARGSFDLVMSDHAMPGMDGLELLAHVRATSPGTLCVLLSGGGATLDERLARIVDQLIGKPYSNHALRETVTRMLEGSAADRA